MKFSKGQTFVEVIIIVSVVVIIVTALVSGSINSLKITGYNTLKSQATKYAQEGVELARKDRDSSWNVFSSRGTSGPRNWCLDKTGIWTEQTPCTANIDQTFTRTVVFNYNSGTGSMDTIVTVTWQDGSNTRTSKIETLFTQWR